MTAEPPADVAASMAVDRDRKIELLEAFLSEHSDAWPWELAERLVDAGWSPPFAPCPPPT